MHTSELRKKSVEDLKQRLSELKTKIIKEKMDIALRKTKNVGIITKLKNEIAIINTLLNENKNG